ncbi:MAG: hypothetical protein ACREBU_00535 [Nitrososphaera sp.]
MTEVTVTDTPPETPPAPAPEAPPPVVVAQTPAGGDEQAALEAGIAIGATAVAAAVAGETAAEAARVADSAVTSLEYMSTELSSLAQRVGALEAIQAAVVEEVLEEPETQGEPPKEDEGILKWL